MAEKTRSWSTGKIVGVTLLVLGLLTALCCGGVALLWGEQIGATWMFGLRYATFQTDMQDRLGADTAVALETGTIGQIIVLVGVPADEDLTPERVVELQDLAWERWEAAFHEGGVPVIRIGIGRASGTAAVREYEQNLVDVEVVVERTGIPEPPQLEGFPGLGR